MKVLDLFSGIGGFSLGLERAGMETVAFCEYDKKAQLVLKKHWPEVPIYEDVRTLTGKQIREEIGAIDLICGGFPCQGFSVAGKRAGVKDDRYLWPEYFRLIQEIRPRWVIGENVTGIIDLALDQVLSDLEGEGYSCQALIIPACAVNAPHRRDRVWIVAHSNRRLSERPEFKIQPGRDAFGVGRENVADSNGIRRRHGGEPESESFNAEFACENDSNSTGSGLEKRQGVRSIRSGAHTAIETFSQWDVEPELGRVADGIPNRVDRLRQLGNAVVPQVVEVIGRAIMEIDKK